MSFGYSKGGRKSTKFLNKNDEMVAADDDDSVDSDDSIETKSETNSNEVIRDFFPETWLWSIESLE
jgi:hypothetical protein